MSIGIHRLANGLRIVTEPMPGLHSAAVGIWVTAGGRNERIEQNGVAHFLEHMMFKGSPNVASGTFSRRVGREGGNDNAFAWIGSGAFTGAAGQLRIASVADDILLQGDVNGDGVADLAIRVDAASLAASDVLL